MSQSALPPNDKEMTLIQHLLELKSSLTRSIIAIILFFLILFPFANEIYTYISEPLTRYLPENTSMIATAVASPFLTPFKLSFVLAIYLAMPYLLYQVWRFISPALYRHERQLVGPILFSSSFLFYSGGLFAYYVVFPLVFGFLTQTGPEKVTIATDITLYLDFVIKMFFAFGLAFEVPIITVLLILSGITNPQKMSHARPYVIVGAFVIGMLLTPPDIISQTLLAVPVWLLYEMGLIIGTYVLKRRQAKKDTDPDNDPDDPTDPNSPTGTKTADTSQQENRSTTQPSEENNATTEYDFDDRYADQVDDDLDWDAEFAQIESEMSQLDQEYEAKKQAKKDAENSADSSESADKHTDTLATESNQETSSDTSTAGDNTPPKS